MVFEIDARASSVFILSSLIQRTKRNEKQGINQRREEDLVAFAKMNQQSSKKIGKTLT